MMNNFDENYIIELVKKELSKYLTDQGIETKKEVCFQWEILLQSRFFLAQVH